MNIENTIYFKYDFHDLVEFNHDREPFNCTGECSGICRCRRVVDESVYSAKDIYHRCVMPYRLKKSENNDGRLIEIPIVLDTIDKYCIDKLLSIHDYYNTEIYEPSITADYYGEYINKTICNKDSENFEKDVTKLLSFQDPLEKVMFILERDYGYLARVLHECSGVKVVDVPLSDIIPARMFDQFVPEKEYHADLTLMTCYGVLFNGRLIDGHHRFHELAKREKNTKNRPKYRYIELY